MLDFLRENVYNMLSLGARRPNPPAGDTSVPFEDKELKEKASGMTKVFIDGNQGTTGLRISERLGGRTDIELAILPEEKRKDLAARAEAANGADVVFLCLPDAAAKEIAALITNPHTTVIDASTAHRTNPAWAYGFPELSAARRARIAQGGRIAVPGCHASGFVSLVYPLITGGIADAEYPFVCHSVTGYSGGGKSMIAAYEASDRPAAYDSPRQYGISQAHKHLPEMQAVCGLAYPPAFTPIVADFYAGMAVTVPLCARLLAKKYSVSELRRYFADFYAGAKLVSVFSEAETEAEGGFVAANPLGGRDGMEIIVAGNDERPLLISRFDNLGKGASGAAIQCMNLALGLDETTGLSI